MNKFRLFLFLGPSGLSWVPTSLKEGVRGGIGRYWGASGTGECGPLCCVFVYVPRGANQNPNTR